jgi:hypothetical protein
MKFAALTFSALCAAALLVPAALAADKKPQAAQAPFPPQIATAKNIFLSYAGAGCEPSEWKYSGTRDRAFNQFYIAAQSKLPYQVVGTPSNADLILEFSVVCGPASGASSVSMNFILRIYAPKDGVTLWTFTEPVKIKLGLQKSQDENFDLALTSLVDDAQRASNPAVPAATPTP